MQWMAPSEKKPGTETPPKPPWAEDDPVLVSRLRAALERLNPALPPEAITAAVDELTRDRSAIPLDDQFKFFIRQRARPPGFQNLRPLLWGGMFANQ
jgi:hypothetical protein